ncbi:replication initiation and membrane attachment family protein [Indiicoccus explosivorum]|uniref:replication initiation and membrane attachment family protein n=1 Tax=Indiicoccus explosivorum TaxID=1917864 RepID=UPI000B453265|nr:DnaD domain protein [Indiicoccus explosivorum]
MAATYNELHPTDAYCVFLPYPFSDYDRQLLTLLYQPLIGFEAAALYLTLWAEGESMKEPAPHYRLMEGMGTSDSAILDSRIRLEAIGLLKSFRKEGEQRSFIYELCPPLDPKTFFSDPLLSMFLFRKIGESAYKRTRERLTAHLPNKEGFAEVSRTFTDVFTPVREKDGIPAQADDGQTRARTPYETEIDFDFGTLRQGLSEQLVPARVLTPAIRLLIAKLAFLYGFGPLDMQKVVLLAVGDDFQLKEDALKKAAADLYKMTVSAKAPELAPVRQAKKDRENTQPKTRQDEIIDYFETASPAEVLRDIADGKEPLPADVQLANQLVLTHGMEPPVVNVLLQYVLLKTDMKLTKGYVEKIASHWIRKNVRTAKEAMELARTEHDQYVKWKKEGPAPSSGNRRKSGREEKVPDWFHNKETDLKTPPENSASGDAARSSLEEEKRKLLAELAMRKGKGE